MTCDLQWLLLGLAGSALLWRVVLRRGRGASGAAALRQLTDDRSRMALLVGLPFAIRLLQVRSPGADAGAYPELTFPLAPWALWWVAVLLLVLPLSLLGPRGSRREVGWLAAAAAPLLAVVVMGAADSPFDRAGFASAWTEHEKFCRSLVDEVPEEFPELREPFAAVVEKELAGARAGAAALFDRQGLPPVLAYLDRSAASLEKQADGKLAQVAGLREARRRAELAQREMEERSRSWEFSSSSTASY